MRETVGRCVPSVLMACSSGTSPDCLNIDSTRGILKWLVVGRGNFLRLEASAAPLGDFLVVKRVLRGYRRYLSMRHGILHSACGAKKKPAT